MRCWLSTYREREIDIDQEFGGGSKAPKDPEAFDSPLNNNQGYKEQSCPKLGNQSCGEQLGEDGCSTPDPAEAVPGLWQLLSPKYIDISHLDARALVTSQ